jgi:peptidoglycan hydrolase-like protein with peptidoglycan-binding domain
LNWVNPSSDFHHAKIYRSTVSGNTGKVVYNDLFSNTQIDSGLSSPAVYYYLVRSVDPAGNESLNTDQVSVNTSGSGQGKQPYVFTRNLSLGDRGVDVTNLQTILFKDGVYPEGEITGYFGNLTKAAVARFQEKYRNEVLVPAGLSQGNGYVGMLTRSKLGALAPVYGIYLADIFFGVEFSSDLSVGMENEDIKKLQQILVDEGVYPEGKISGYFGNLTQAAVVRFQEKYKSEILAPAGMDKGTGYVGPATRTKLNQIAKAGQ